MKNYMRAILLKDIKMISIEFDNMHSASIDVPSGSVVYVNPSTWTDILYVYHIKNYTKFYAFIRQGDFVHI